MYPLELEPLLSLEKDFRILMVMRPLLREGLCLHGLSP
jgi:hypothetical protein